VRRAPAVIAMLALLAMGCGLWESPDPGTLPESYSSMSGPQFDTLVGSVSWVDGYTRDRCTDSVCTANVPVQIEANANSYTIDSLNPGVEGKLVARVRNKGLDTTYMYHFKPAPYRYYFLVKRPVGGPTKWVLLEQVAGSAPDSVSSGPFTGCWDDPPATTAAADFRNCKARITSAFQGAKVTALATSEGAPLALRSARTLAAIEPGGWIGCAYGCCPLGYGTY